MQSFCQGKSETNQWLANIQYENERMGLLVSQLLELARTENVVPKMEHIDFSYLGKRRNAAV